MTALTPDTVLLVFVLFCRIGGCLMFMPGFSSPRVPVQVRLFLAVAITLALAPVVVPTLQSSVRQMGAGALAPVIISETLTGSLIGLMGRFFYLALQFMGTSLAAFIGIGNTPGAPIEDNEPLPAVGTLITMTATVMLFLADQHWEVLRALVASYGVLPVTEPFSAAFGTTRLTQSAADAFLLALQISSPFVVYSIIINLLFGIMNKLTPQIPVYFISLPFVVAGGMAVLYFTAGEMLSLFISGFTAWLARG
ncbi:MAG: flagellar biosynthesis protein FliR [Hyphomicrobiaceae bacterium]